MATAQQGGTVFTIHVMPASDSYQKAIAEEAISDVVEIQREFAT